MKISVKALAAKEESKEESSEEDKEAE